jgi:hypothetical protein
MASYVKVDRAHACSIRTALSDVSGWLKLGYYSITLDERNSLRRWDSFRGTIKVPEIWEISPLCFNSSSTANGNHTLDSSYISQSLLHCHIV